MRHIRQAESPGWVSFSRRERAILAQIADGVSDKEIAAVLGVSIMGVRNRIYCIMGLTRLHNRTLLAIWVRQNLACLEPDARTALPGRIVPLAELAELRPQS